MIDMDAKELAVVSDILSTYASEYEVRVFGSRVRDCASRYSDLDLALVGEEKVSWSQLEDLKDAFSESDLSIMVDLVDWNSVSDKFKAAIDEKYVVLQRSPK